MKTKEFLWLVGAVVVGLVVIGFIRPMLAKINITV